MLEIHNKEEFKMSTVYSKNCAIVNGPAYDEANKITKKETKKEGK